MSSHGWPRRDAGGLITHLYVHVPFCPRICPFCSFDVVERRAGAVDAYLGRLEREASELAERWGDRLDLDTVYVGGGTPSHLRANEIERLVGILSEHLGWAGSEATLEVHPSNVTPDRARDWVDLGFTRLSVGVESTDDEVLGYLGRSHDARSALTAVEAAVVAGATVSADLITAVPGQDIGVEVERLVASGVHHVSAYTLTVEEGTPFASRGVVVDEGLAARAFDEVDGRLASHGFSRYEVSNHSRHGHECRHNLGYWVDDWWVALGPSGAGHEPPLPGDGEGAVSVRVTNAPFAEWPFGAAPEREVRDSGGALVDAVVAGLRLTAGVDLDRLSERLGLDARSRLDQPIAAAVERGWADLTGSSLVPTSAGVRVLDRVAELFC